MNRLSTYKKSKSMQAFIDWLAATRPSLLIQNVEWVIPTVQIIHILSIAIVISSVLMINVRVIGVIPGTQPVAAVARRFLPWIWWTLIVLLLSGSTLIVGEPARSLMNPAFLLKMSMLVIVLILMFAFQRGLRRNDQFWDQSRGRRIGARVIAVVSLVLWIGIVFAGRWIAYVTSDGGR